MNSTKLYVGGNVVINLDGYLNIAKGTLDVEGTLTQKGKLDVNIGELRIAGDYNLERGTFNAGNGKTEVKGNFLANGITAGYSRSYSHFVMNGNTAYVLVHGDFDLCSDYENQYINGGTLEVKGDFSVGNEEYNFPAKGTHKVILSGNREQKVNFARSDSYFNILINKNPNAIFTSKNYKYLFTEIPYITTIVTNTSKGAITKILDSTIKNSAITQINSLGTLTKDGYYFKGWYLDKEYTMPLTAENDIITSDMTLYAKWVEPMLFNNVSYSLNNRELSVDILLDEELESQNGTVIITVYDDTKLVDIYYTSAKGTVSHAFEDIPVAENGYTIKVFCWKDFMNLMPLCDGIETKVQ